MPKQSSFNLKSAKKPYIPSKIDLTHLDKDGFLLPKEQLGKVRQLVNEVKEKLKNNPEHYAQLKNKLDQSRRNLSTLKDDMNFKETHFREIDRLLSDLDTAEDNLNSIPNLEEQKQQLADAIVEKEKSLANFDQQIKEHTDMLLEEGTDIKQDKELKQLIKFKEKAQAKLKEWRKELEELQNENPEIIAQKTEEMEESRAEYQKEIVEHRKSLITIIRSDSSQTQDEETLLGEEASELGKLARVTLEKRYEKLATQIEQEQLIIKEQEALLAPTQAKLRKAYLSTQNIDTQLDILVVPEAEGEFKVLTAYLGTKKGKSLGAGAFGKVKIAQDEEGNFWAVKYLEKNRLPQLQQKEYELLQKLNEAGGRLEFTSVKNVRRTGPETNVMVMKLAHGVPLSVPPPSMTDLATMEKLEAISDAVLNLHRKNIIHFDLKPENILYDVANKKATIIDYGTAVIIPEGKKGLLPTRGGETPPKIKWGFVALLFMRRKKCVRIYLP